MVQAYGGTQKRRAPEGCAPLRCCCDAGECLGAGLRVHVGGKCGLRCCNDRCERRRLGDREVGEDATVDLDASEVQSLDEAVVGEAVGARCGVDALDPQATEVTLAGAAVTVRVDEGVCDLLLGLAVEARTLPAVPLGALEDDPALLVSVDCSLYSCHCSVPKLLG
jgi:hypothetical protein